MDGLLGRTAAVFITPFTFSIGEIDVDDLGEVGAPDSDISTVLFPVYTGGQD